MSSKQLPEKNRVIIAVAGAGKTTRLVYEALSTNGRVLIVTYTNENVANIKNMFLKKVGYVPPNVEVLGWFTFLLRHGVRPYHNYLSSGSRVLSVHLINGSSAAIDALKYVAEADTEHYYFDENRRIYSDKISKYVVKCNEASDGRVIARLEAVYSSILIDEVQDLAGWDLDLLLLLMKSRIETLMVGDPRQITYLTNHARKNTKYKNGRIVNFFQEEEEKGFCQVEYMNACLRCTEAICTLANQIYPKLPPSIPAVEYEQEHFGVFIIRPEEVPGYIQTHNPVILRYNKAANTQGFNAINYGASKGNTYDHVLIFPTIGIRKFLNSRNPEDIGDRAKFYVAVTRARFSVALVV